MQEKNSDNEYDYSIEDQKRISNFDGIDTIEKALLYVEQQERIFWS